MFTTLIAQYFQIRILLSLIAGLVMTSSTWIAIWYPFPGAPGAVSESSRSQHLCLYESSDFLNVPYAGTYTNGQSLASRIPSFAYMFRCLDMQLYETTTDDMKWGDYFAPMTRKNLEVKVLSSTHLSFDKAIT
ncbi:Cytochrome P450 [Penicillium coprophilum]|uniref:Cytochrome P450 n=1 Tax=Penicillium coprophilum TaxID=36646 RepID=UPI00239FCDDC|nr:Cytochrome P450 [Penicillium coprophilum]KAJ5170216.1 Cytochrome P450 [Penicillium coprophilum]